MKKGDANLFLCPPVRERRANIGLLVKHYCDGERRDVRSQHDQQLGDGHVEVGEIVTLSKKVAPIRKPRTHVQGFPAACLTELPRNKLRGVEAKALGAKLWGE